MKKCTIVVTKIYETKKTRTMTERTITLSKDALSELCTIVLKHVNSVDNSSLNLLCEAFTGL